MANNDIKLSILICSVQDRDREENLKNIEHELKDQICKNYAENIVEILIEKDNREMSVGRKRNVLIDKAKGEYVCFIDDDDFISKDYLNIILENLKKDILLIRINHVLNGVRTKPIQTSLYIDHLETNDFIFKTNHFHLCPVKKELASKVLFDEINFAEDLIYSQKLVPLITSYETINQEIYTYNDNLQNSFTRNV